MQDTQTLKRPIEASEPGSKALLLLDLGNGQVKGRVRTADNGKFQDISFPSYVATPTRVGSRCIQFKQGNHIVTRLVGEHAAAIPQSHTGKTANGKAENARALLFHALRSVVGDRAAIHINIIFTTPSSKEYGRSIAAEFEGVHPVTIPASPDVPGDRPQQFTVVVHKAVPVLEGHLVCKSLNLKQDSWLLDVGNRTAIATKVTPSGEILKRTYLGGVGVRGIAERLASTEALPIAEPTAEKIIPVLFSDGLNAATVRPAIDFCMAGVLGFIGGDSAPRFVLGGGALVPGVAEALDAEPVKNPQWANIRAIEAIADSILGG